MSVMWPWIGVMLGFPLIFDALNNRSGRAKNALLWAVMWCQAGLVAFSTWRLYQNWRVVLVLTSHDPLSQKYRADFPYAFLWLMTVLTVFLIVCPMAWYYLDRRKDRLTGITA